MSEDNDDDRQQFICIGGPYPLHYIWLSNNAELQKTAIIEAKGKRGYYQRRRQDLTLDWHES